MKLKSILLTLLILCLILGWGLQNIHIAMKDADNEAKQLAGQKQRNIVLADIQLPDTINALDTQLAAFETLTGTKLENMFVDDKYEKATPAVLRYRAKHLGNESLEDVYNDANRQLVQTTVYLMRAEKNWNRNEGRPGLLQSIQRPIGANDADDWAEAEKLSLAVRATQFRSR